MKVLAPITAPVVRLLVLAWLALAGAGRAEAPPAGLQSASRRILAGDRLNISVREQPDMSRVYAVAGDGSIDFGSIEDLNRILAVMAPEVNTVNVEAVTE